MQSAVELDEGDGFTLLTGRKVGIAHGHFDVLVTKQAAYQRQGGSRLDKPGSKGMPEGMEADTLTAIRDAPVETAVLHGPAEYMVTSFGQPSVFLEKGQVVPRLVSVFLHDSQRMRVERDDTAQAVLGIVDLDLRIFGIDRVRSHVVYLPCAQAGIHGKSRHITPKHGGFLQLFEQLSDFVGSQESQSPIIEFRHPEPGNRAGVQFPFFGSVQDSAGKGEAVIDALRT